MSEPETTGEQLGQSADGKCAFGFIASDHGISLCLESPKGAIRLSVFSNATPELRLTTDGDQPRAVIYFDVISRQPMLALKTQAGRDFFIPLDKAIESLNSRGLI